MSTSPAISPDTTKRTSPDSYPFSAMFGELLFVILPFGVIFLVFAYQQRSSLSYLMAPEWAFASSALFGQTIVKFVQGMTNSPGDGIIERINLFVSAMIVLGLVPSMTVLAIVLVSTNPPVWLGFTQIGLAFVAALTFVFIGGACHVLERGEVKGKE